ncbi:polysaccharide deacetylase family protein [Viscerimonas tarda]
MNLKNLFLVICLLFVLSLSAQENGIIHIAKYRDNKACAISYTFDDGLKEHYTLVAPQFKELGFKGTFWINGSKINPNESDIKDTTRMTWRNLKEMAALGHEISNHGWAHKNFGRFSLDEIKEDIYKNDSAIFANTGIMPRTFCYPNNTKTPEGLIIASENRVGARTEQWSVGGKSTADKLEKWVNTLMETNDWGVTMTHGITYGYDHFSDSSIFWEHLRKVKAQEDKIWIGTFAEVAAYVKERKSLRYQIVETKDGYKVIPECSLDKTLFNEPLTAVIEIPNIQKISIRQGDKKIEALILPNKALFDFDPFGGTIDIILSPDKK